MRAGALLLLAVAGLAPAAAGTARSAESIQRESAPTELGCVTDRVSRAQMRAFSEAVLAQAPRGDPRLAPILGAAEACGDELSWSPARRRLAPMLTAAIAGTIGIREELGGQGMTFDELDRVILADRAFMADAAAGRLGDPAIGQAFALRHYDVIERAARGRLTDRAVALRIGNYIAYRALSETLSRQFSEAR